MCRLAWVFAGCLCDKYPFLMCWLIFLLQFSLLEKVLITYRQQMPRSACTLAVWSAPSFATYNINRCLSPDKKRPDDIWDQCRPRSAHASMLSDQSPMFANIICGLKKILLAKQCRPCKIRLGRCTGWSESTLVSYAVRQTQDLLLIISYC